MIDEESLRYIWGNVNDWLKWAETKTAALFAVDIAIIVAVLSLVEGDIFKGELSLKHIFMIFSLACIFLSAGACVWSFWPRLGKIRKGTNLLLFSDIGSFSDGKAYLDQLKEKTMHDKNESLLKMYADEIVMNSRICKKKYSHFKVGMGFATCGLVGFLVFMVITICQ